MGGFPLPRKSFHRKSVCCWYIKTQHKFLFNNDVKILRNLTSGFGDFNNDHSKRTPSRRSMILENRKHVERKAKLIFRRKLEIKSIWFSNLMLSASVAHAPTALVTLTRRSWLVLVSRFTRGEIPPAFRMDDLLGGI